MGYIPKDRKCPHCGKSLTQQPKHVPVMGIVKNATPKALLIESGGKTAWVPRSQVEYGGMLHKGDTKLNVIDWVVERAGLQTE